MHTKNALQAWFLLAGDEVERRLHAASLTLREMATLTLIAGNPECTTDWLHARVGLTQSGAVRLLDRLVERGLVRRGKRGAGRMVGLELTGHGERMRRRGLAARDAALDAALSPLSADDQELLARLLTRALQGRSLDRATADRTCRACDWPKCGRACPVDAAVSPGS